MTPPPLNPEWLRQALAGGRFGDPLFYEERIGSTNDRALELLEAGYPQGTLVLAEEQTRGRGRRERAWLSPPRLGIYASLILRPALPPSALGLVTLAAAVGVARALEGRLGRAVKIKWPNDLIVAGQKIAGLLAEGRGGGAAPAAVVGLGLNVNHQETDFPAELHDRVASLRMLSGREWDRQVLLPEILRAWAEEHRDLESGGTNRVLRRWEQASFFPPGTGVVVDLGGETRTGVYRGVGPGGELRLEEGSGIIRSVSFGEVERLREER